VPHPAPPPYKAVASPGPEVYVSEPWKTKPSSEPFRSATNGAIATKALKPSLITSNGPHRALDDHEAETFDVPVNSPYDYEVKKTTAEADKELKELFEGAMEDGPAEIDMSEAIVDGFVDGITLKPHQVRP
jgi:hypothetical protein